MTEGFEQRLASLPTRPGVYLMKDASGTIIYVGKARSLRNRVRTYFQSLDDAPGRTRAMVSHIADFEYIVTSSELEALLLEDNLVKKHKPRYNVRLRDDKHYPYIRVSLEEQYPRIYRVRQMRDDGGRYFGPFTSSQAVNETLALVKRLFPYRSCNLDIRDEAEDPTHGRACLEYHIHRCLAPCIKAVDQTTYRATIEQACLFLAGKQADVVRALRDQMAVAAESLQFERAARLRDQIQAVERVIEKQKVVSSTLLDQDVIGLAREDSQACLQLFLVRGGKITGRDHHVFHDVDEVPDGELLSAFLQQFYNDAVALPTEVLLPTEPDDLDLLQEFLRSSRKGRSELLVPKRGDKQKLVDLANENARELLAHERVKFLSNRQRTLEAASELGRYLELPGFPHRIECYDISNIQGTSAVGAMVVFLDGQPRNQEYRRFKIKTVQGSDDFSMLREMLRRRFSRAVRDRADAAEQADVLDADQIVAVDPDTSEPLAAVMPADERAADSGEIREGWAAWPDLVIVDGGKGQVSSAAEVFAELGISHIPLYGLAKQQEELFKPGESRSLLLPRTAPSLYLLQRIRDETHRFAITFHRQVRGKKSLVSSLDAVQGIGPARRKALIRTFGSVHGIKQATEEDLCKVQGITPQLAQRIKQELTPGG